MIKEIIFSSDSLEDRIQQIGEYLKTYDFIESIFYPDDFLEIFLPFSVIVLNTHSPEKGSPYSCGNDHRRFILKTLNKFILKDTKNIELVKCLHDTLENDNLFNVVLTLKIFVSLNKSSIMTNEIFDFHMNSIMNLLDSIFDKLEENDDNIIEQSFFTLVQIFSYVADIVQRHNYPEKKIESIIFRAVNFYRVFLDNRDALDLINFKKNISLELISSISKFIKIVSESKMFPVRNDPFNSMIMELAKFAVYYCPVDAIDLRKEMFFYIFRILLKSRDFFVPKIEDFFDFRFFYSSESYLTNIKGLIGLTDIAVVFSDSLTKRIPFELILRTKEILESSMSVIYEKMDNKDEEFLSVCNSIEERCQINLMEDEKCFVYERSLRFHLEIILEGVNSISKQFLLVSKQHLQKIELLEYCHRQFKMIFNVIVLIEKIISTLDNSEIKKVIKYVFLSGGRSYKEISEKVTEIINSTMDLNIFTIFKADKFYTLFETSLNLVQKLDFEEKEVTRVENFYSIFFIPVDLLFVDVTKRFFFKIIAGASKNNIIFDVLKKLLCDDANGSLLFSQCTELLVSILNYDIKRLRNKKTDEVQNIIVLSEYDLSFSHKYFDQRVANNFEFYSKYFSIVCNYFNLNVNKLTKNNILDLFLCFNSLAMSGNVFLHKILLSCFKILNAIKDKINIFQMYFYKAFKHFVTLFHELFLSTNNSLYLELIFSMPVNFNLVISHWCYLLRPIHSAIRVFDDITHKALSVFLYMIENSKKEIFDDEYKHQLQLIFYDIFSLLESPKFSIVCSQILGKIKSYHRKYLHKEIYNVDRFFYKGMLHLVLDDKEIVLDDVVIEAIQLLRGDYIYDEVTRISRPNRFNKFQCRFKSVRKNEETVQKSFNIISDFIYSSIGWGKYGEDQVIEKVTIHIENLINDVRRLIRYYEEIDPDFYMSKELKIPFCDQLTRSQYMYDAILSLFECEGYKIEARAIKLLELIFRNVAIYWFLELFFFKGHRRRVILNRKIYYYALFESFEIEKRAMARHIFKFFLDKCLQMTGSMEIFLKCNILSEIFEYTVRYFKSSNEREVIAAKNVLCCFLDWNSIPSKMISEKINIILSSFYLYIQKVGRNWEECIRVIKNMLKVLVDEYPDFDYKKVLSSFFSGLFSIDKNERIFSKRCLKIYKEIVGNKCFKEFKLPVVIFLKQVVYKKDLDAHVRRMDVLVFLIIKFNFFFTREELNTWIWFYIYSLYAFNFFGKLSSESSLFETDISKIYSENFKEQELRLFKSSDIIFNIYYKLGTQGIHSILKDGNESSVDIKENSESEYAKYLMYEIIYMFMAISDQKNKTKFAFDLIFNNLPFGFVIPLKKLYRVNSSLVKEHLLDKYEECFIESLSVNTIKKMIAIFSVIEIHDDPRLVDFISKIFIEFRNQREILIFSENAEDSILVKTFELSLMFPNQTELYDKIILIVYTLFYQFSKTYISKTENIMLKYIEAHSQLVFPFIVKHIMEDSVYHLGKKAFEASISFKNFVYNLNSVIMDEVIFSIRTLDFNNILDIQKTINLFNFLRLINYDIENSHVQLCLMVFRELKKKNKRLESMKKFIRFSINKFTPQDFEVLFSIDPLFKINNSCSVKIFKSITNKAIMTCLLRSINKNDTKSFENLVRFFGEQSWMLVELFVKVGFFSQSMLDYCKSNLHNVNIRCHLLYYLCHYEPQSQYFNLLFELSYEERKYTLYCLKKISQNCDSSMFEDTILKLLNSEIRYKTNIHILYPLLISVPSLMTENIAKELVVTIHRLLNTFVQFHQKMGANIFNLVYDFYYNLIFEKDDLLTWWEKFEVLKEEHFFNILTNLYTILFINFIHSKRSTILDHFLKYVLLLDLDSITFYSDSINIENVILFLEQEIGIGKPVEYIESLIILLYKIIHQEWLKYKVSEDLIRLLNDCKLINIGNLILKPINRDMNKVTFLNMLLILIEDDFTDLNNDFAYNNIIEIFSDYGADNEESTFKQLKVFVEKIIEKIFKKNYPHEEFIRFYTKLLKLDISTYIDWKYSIMNVLVNKKISINESISLLLLLHSKIKEGNKILDIGSLLDVTLYFYSNNKYLKLNTLKKISEIFFIGLTYSDTLIRGRYFQMLSDSLPISLECRFMSLLDLDYESIDKRYIPYIINTMIFECFESVTMDSCMLYALGSYNLPKSVLKQAYLEVIRYPNYIGERFKSMCIDKFLMDTNDFCPINFKNNLFEFLYHSIKGNLKLLGRVIKLCTMKLSTNDYNMVVSKLIFITKQCKFNDALTSVIIESLDMKKATLTDLDIKVLRRGKNSWICLLDVVNDKSKMELYRDMRNTDYYYGFMRSRAKFPEVMQAFTYQQLEKFKEAGDLYEEIQDSAVASKISFDDDEYSTILNEWIECAKELQQWDTCYSIGKCKGDSTLSTDSMFYTSNFNVSVERDNFANILNLIEPGIKKSLYELFNSLYVKTSTEKIIALVKKIISKIYNGPRMKEYDSYFLLLLQVVFEMHESSFIFNKDIDNFDKINALLYRWEHREPQIEDNYTNLSFHHAWRKHVYRKIEHFSNESVCTEALNNKKLSSPIGKYKQVNQIQMPKSLGELGNIKQEHLENQKKFNLSGIVNKNKEFSENLTKLRKNMFIIGNNGLGRNSNYLALAALKKGLYDNALFLFNDVFDLPSIKIIDAYNKVINELMCFYEMKEYNAGLNLANSTNISHFSDEQSSNLFRIRGMFCERLKKADEAEKLFFQAIQVSSLSVNFLCYARLLIKKYKIFEQQDIDKDIYVKQDGTKGKYDDNKHKANNQLPENIGDELLSAILQGICCSNDDYSRELIVLLLLILKLKKFSFDEFMFKSIIKNCNPSCFVVFIPNIAELLLLDNYNYALMILSHLFKVYPQPVVLELNLIVNKLKSKNILVISDYERIYKIIKGLPNQEKVNTIMYNVFSFRKIVAQASFEKEFNVLKILDLLIDDTVSIIYDNRILMRWFENFNRFFCSVSSSFMCGEQLFIPLFYFLQNDVLCPYKMLDIFISMRDEIKCIVETSFLISVLEVNDSFCNRIGNEDVKTYIYGSYNQIRKDYRNMVYVEFFDVTPDHRNKREYKTDSLYFIGNDGKYYKYECFVVRGMKDKNFNLAHFAQFINHKIKKNYKLRCREASLRCLLNQRLFFDMYVNVIENSFYEMDQIYEEYRIRNQIKHSYIKYYECIDEQLEHPFYQHDHDFEDHEENFESTPFENSFEDKNSSQGKNISNEELKDSIEKIMNKQKYKICNFRYKLNLKVKLKAFTSVLEENIVPTLLDDFLRDKYIDAYSYFLFRDTALKTFSTYTMLSYSTFTVNKNLKNILIYSDKGYYINRALGNSEVFNEIYTSNISMFISPNIQNLFKRDGLEGPFASIIYFGFQMLDKGEWFEDLIRLYYEYFDNNNIKYEDLIFNIKSRISEVLKEENNDFYVLKVINEWSDINNIGKVRITQFPWL